MVGLVLIVGFLGISLLGWQLFNGQTGPSSQEQSNTNAELTVLEPTPNTTVDNTLHIRLDLKSIQDVDRVEAYIDGILRHVSYSPPFAFSIDTSTQTNGTHTLLIKVINAAGGVVDSREVSFTVQHNIPENSPTDEQSGIRANQTATTQSQYSNNTKPSSSGEPDSSEETTPPDDNPEPGDTTSPTTPANVQVEVTGLTTIDVTWAASSDAVGVVSYKVYRNGILASTVAAPTLTFNDVERTPSTAYSYTVQAVDAAGNQSTPSLSMGVTLPGATIWAEDTPADIVADDPDTNLNYGVRFRPKVEGTITGIRFYKLADNTGVHIGALWTAEGRKLADVTFTNESATGWQTATFSQPVDVAADTVYVASYHTNEGSGAVTPAYFETSGHGNEFIEALAGTDGGNGVYLLNDFVVFPTQTFNNSNYWVDVVFTPGTVDSQIAVSSMPRIPWEGGPSYYSQFSPTNNSSFTDNNFFPLSVWAVSVLTQNDVDLDKSYGMNSYFEQTDDTDLSLVRDNGMLSVSGEINGYGDEMVGWLVGDEVDMWGGAGNSAWTGNFPGQGEICNPASPPGEPCGFTIMDQLLANFPADLRMRFANYGKGVIMWNSNEHASQFVNTYTDATAADIYFYTDPNICEPNGEAELYLGIPTDKCRQSSGYGYTMDRMRYLDSLDGHLQPIYAFIENNHPFPYDQAPTITADQMAGAVMNSIIHEARGIIYFNHSFGGPCGVVFNVLRSSCGDAVRPKTIETNQRLAALAPVLNTQSYKYKFNHKLDTMFKAHDGSYYIFAMAKRDTAPGSYSFTLPAELASVSSVEVMFENRNRLVTNGNFTDSFAAEHSYHIYRITP